MVDWNEDWGDPNCVRRVRACVRGAFELRRVHSHS